jgi:hypothetical protein
MQAFGESAFVTKNSKAATMDRCVEPTKQMRLNHMDYLKHVRDDTVRDGVRGLDHSLTGCIDCHASRDKSGKGVPVNKEGEFCQACHGYVAVNPPCFQCHRTTPEPGNNKSGHGYHPTDFSNVGQISHTPNRQRD